LKTTFLILAFLCASTFSYSQILTSSPYSRYGVGELNLQSFAAPAAMGGSFIAYQQDSIAPYYINAANPASLAGLRYTVFELGGQAQFTKISSSTTSIDKRNMNFSYGSIGFPIKRIGGAAFGVMPYSTVGYNITSKEDVAGVGEMKYIFNGDGGINKVFLGTGLKPFKKAGSRFSRSALSDSLRKNHFAAKYKRKKFGKQLLSDLSLGITANYLFGSINQTTDVIYPGSITYYNVKRQRSIHVSDFAFNAGLQTSFLIDSIRYHGKDSLKRGHRRSFRLPIKVGMGLFVNTPSSINAKQNNIIYNYALDGFGIERPRDTVLNSQDNKGTIKLPLEIGVGFSMKKGEKLTVLMDAAMTNWSGFKYFEAPNTDFKNSYRVSVGLNYVPNKLAYGSSNYIKRIHYRLGATYSDGYLDLKNTKISNYAVTAGLGLPVGIGRFDDVAVVNISAQYGRMGSVSNNLLQEDYLRIILGFTFNKRWFIKYKYD
jgi:hypothetical protein